ncbi:MAG TPA: hypothetical protein VEW48_08880 [Thermoanaerobaculia bacterium]|nr:hypothetical protein [Thermoanaerobaculia bacterium]
MSVHGVTRSTADVDFLVLDPSCLRLDFWTALESRGVVVDVRKGDLTDPLAGVVRFKVPGEGDVDVVVGKFKWQRKILDRAPLRTTQQGNLPVVRAADLILMKLHAGGPQDAWDILGLLGREGRDELIAEVEKLLPDLPSDAVKLWRRILEG